MDPLGGSFGCFFWLDGVHAVYVACVAGSVNGGSMEKVFGFLRECHNGSLAPIFKVD